MLKNYFRLRMVEKEIYIYNIQDVEKLSGLSHDTIYKLYRNRNVETIKLSTLIKLCDAFNCDLSDIVEYTPEK